MRTILLMTVLVALATPGSATAQRGGQRKMSEEEFAKAKPAVGDVIPDVTVYDSAGREVKTSRLRGHYTVLTFGCLT
jgi:cytochrome oxidase Cu insertion factor (SCO1/SenC/PrrC family)